MKILITFLLVIIALSADAAVEITARITVTNSPANNDLLTVNGDVRTNKSVVVLPSKNILIGADAGFHATNLWRQITSYPYSGNLLYRFSSTNILDLRGMAGAAMTVTASGTWATVTYTTNTVGDEFNLRLPLTALPTSVATNHATIAIDSIFNNSFAQNSVNASSPAMANFVDTSENQTVAGDKNFTGSVTIANGMTVAASAFVDIIGTSTNAEPVTWSVTGEPEHRMRWLADGRIMGGLGSATPVELWQFTPTDRTNKVATLFDVTNRLAAADNTWSGINTFGPLTSTHIYGSTLSNIVVRGSAQVFRDDASNLEIGTNATVTTGKILGVAVGNQASVADDYGVAVGYGAQAAHYAATVIGNGAVSTEASQVRLGQSAHYVSAPNDLKIEDNLLVGDADATAFPASLAKGRFMLNGTAPSADPSGGFADWSGSGEWKYRTGVASEGSTLENRVHNRGSSVQGSGTDYTIPDTAMNRADFGTTDSEVSLATAGTWFVTAYVAIINGATADDVYNVKLYNSTDAADVVQVTVSSINASKIAQANLHSIVTVTSAKTIQIYVQNSTAARGTIDSEQTRITAIRLH